MAEPLKCKICGVRRPRRTCPEVQADICPQCCGKEREETIDCPLDCPYLRESRVHDRPPDPDPDKFPHADIRVTPSFLREREQVLMLLTDALSGAVQSGQGVVDNDVREALDSLVRTFRTTESGLVYETLPVNPYSREIHRKVQERIREINAHLAQRGRSPMRDADVLGILIFLQRLELSHNNGRRRGRAFLDFLRGYFPQKGQEAASAPSLIVQ